MRTQSIVLSIVAGVLIVFLGLSAFLLLRGIRQFARAETELRRQVASLRNYYARDPFPSAANVEREKENAVILREWQESLLDAMREGQIGPVQETPSRFMTLLSAERISLTETGRVSGVKIRGDFDFPFGFDRYSASGVLPAPADVPRLAQQLLIVDRLCRLLFESRIAALHKVERDEFDRSGPPAEGPLSGVSRPTRPGGRPAQGPEATRPRRDVRNAGMLEKSDLFASLHFSLEFVATEKALLEVLNRLAADDMFVVVTSLRLRKERDDIAPLPMTADALEAAPAEPGARKQTLSRQQRMVCGPEMEQTLTAGLELDVYRFAAGPAGRED